MISICVSPPDGIPIAHLVRLPGCFKNLVSGVNPGWDVLHCDALIKGFSHQGTNKEKIKRQAKKIFAFAGCEWNFKVHLY